MNALATRLPDAEELLSCLRMEERVVRPNAVFPEPLVIGKYWHVTFFKELEHIEPSFCKWLLSSIARSGKMIVAAFRYDGGVFRRVIESNADSDALSVWLRHPDEEGFQPYGARFYIYDLADEFVACSEFDWPTIVYSRRILTLPDYQSRRAVPIRSIEQSLIREFNPKGLVDQETAMRNVERFRTNYESPSDRTLPTV